jgi:hypothetical protein
LVVVGALALFIPVGGNAADGRPTVRVDGLDLSGYAGGPPPAPIDVVFLHHSVGTQLLASPGPEQGDRNQPTAHPNGGGLRALLARDGYRLHAATYGSVLGERTDLFDWLPKFREHMDEVLAIANQDTRLDAGTRNRVVIFKSCFPNSNFVGAGTAPGNPAGPELTVANARATMMALRSEFTKYPDVLFVYVTAPPQAPVTWTEPLWKRMVKKALGRTTHTDELRQSGGFARQFNNWVKDPAGWLAAYPHRNVVVFDLFDTLTGHGASNLSRYATGDGSDSHPSAEGNGLAAAEFVPFLNRVVRHAGVVH